MFEAEEVSQKREMSCEVFPSGSEPPGLAAGLVSRQGVTFCQRFYFDCEVLNDKSHVACFKKPTIALLTNVGKSVLSLFVCSCLSPVCGELHPEASMRKAGKESISHREH